MAFIKTRKKIVSSAIASSLSIMAGHAIAQDQATQLEIIHSEASLEQKQSLKVDKSANTKFVAPLLDTPKSVSVISQQLIQDTQVTTLSDALRTVPGITLGAGEGGNPNGDRPFIRGYNSESSIYVDGIRNSTSQNRDMFAVEQVEVVKGSGSSLGGAGSVGGSINMITKEAKKGSFLQGSVEQGTDDYQRITLDGNKDFGNGIAARVAVLGHKNDKPGQSDGAEYKRFGIAPSITFGLDTDTRATLSYYYLKSDDTPDSGVPYGNPNNYKQGSGKPIDVKQGIYYGWTDRDFQKQENQIGTIKLEHDLTEDLTISNIASYSKSKNNYVWTQPDDSTGNFINSTTGELQSPGVWRRANTRITDTDTFTDQLALKGKFNTGSLIHRFNTGVEYSHQKTDKGVYDVLDTVDTTKTACSVGIAASNGWCADTFNPNSSVSFNGTINANRAISTIKTKSTSLYFLDNIEINPQWLLDLGVRWDKFDTSAYYNKTSGSIAAGTTYSTKDDFFNYQAGLTFKPTENGAIYISYATSSNPVGVDAGDGSESLGSVGKGTTAAQAIQINNLKPERTKTYELGTKWDLLQDRLNLTAAIFRTEKTNTRVLVDASTYANAGESKVDGLEIGVNGNITPKWAMSAGYTYLDSKLTKAAYGSSQDEGRQLPNVPKNSATLWTTYQILPQLMIGGGAYAMDKVYGVNTSTTQKFVPGYVRYDLMARYDVTKNVNLQLNVNNVTDKRYFNKAYGSHYATEADGRNAVLSLNFKY